MLRDYQRQCLSAIAELRRASPDVTRIAIEMATGLGKGHPLETEVPTPDGWRRWGDLEPGDSVFGRDGSSTTVLEVYDRGMLETYRVTFSDGSSVLVDGDHLWTVRDSSDSRRPWVNLETRALASLELKRSRGWRFHVPMAAPLERKPRDLPLSPYVVGALISNGSMTGTGTVLTTPDLEVAERIARAVFCNKIKDATPDVCNRYSLSGLTPTTRELGLRVGSLEKRVPAAYLEGSLEQRLELLHGLMDGDGGGRGISRRSVAYFTSSEGLARDVSELVTSLGGTGVVKFYDRGVRGVEYAVRILLPSSVSAFSTARKADAGSMSVRNLQPRRAVVGVEHEGSSPIRCIRVAARDSLYLITRAHIVTHNTITFAAAADDFLEDEVRDRGLERRTVLVLVHTDELVKQAVDKIRTVTRGRWSVGVVKAAQNEVTADIVVASVQTLARPERRAQLTDVGFIIVDECHHAVASTYLEILEHFGGMPDCTCANRDPEGCWDCRNTGWTQQPTPVLGVTATLARSDGQGLGKVWQDVAFTRSLAWGIRHGYLIDLVPYTIKIPGVDAGASDAALDAMLADSIAPEAVVRAWQEMDGRDLQSAERLEPRSTVLFAPLVRSAEAFAAAFNNAGVKAEIVHGKLALAERKAILDRYEQGITTVVCNAMVLTEGWDSPRTMCVIVARPTQSVPLFTQMVGRGVRPWLGADAPSREDQRCVLLCVAGATNELATIADLSDGFGGEAQDGKSLMQMEDEWDLGKDIEPDEDRAYRGPVVVERWDAAVRASTKAWKYTDGGVPFLPTAKRGEGYVFVVETARGCEVYVRYPAAPEHRGFWTNLVTIAPDLELAMALAEDEAQERGGDIGRLLADKGRAWRKAVPSDDMVAMARRAGINVVPVMQDKRAGKAGRLSDMIDKAMASRVLDGIATKIRERASDE